MSPRVLHPLFHPRPAFRHSHRRFPVIREFLTTASAAEAAALVIFLGSCLFIWGFVV